MKRAAAKVAMARSANGTTRFAGGVLDDLELFVAVAQEQSFVAAARRARLGTSSVSRAVARLEGQLGLVLLRRNSRKVVLTDEGRELVHKAAAHLDELQGALAATADGRAELSGVVRVTAPAYTGATRVARALAAFAAAHPQVRIELDASNRLHDLLDDGFDFAVRIGPVADADFVARPLWRGEFCLVAAPAFVRATLHGRARVTRALLESDCCIVLRPAARWRFVAARGRTIEIAPGARFVVNDPRGALEVARQGLGIALVPLDALDASDELVRLDADLGTPAPIDLFVVYPARRQLSRRVRLAIDWLADAPDGTVTGSRRPPGRRGR
jgi:DNA-binding transcriptional LysR family regulator